MKRCSEIYYTIDCQIQQGPGGLCLRNACVYTQSLYTFFILGHISGGRVTVTDGIFAGYIYNYEHVITQRLISEMKRPIRV